MKLGYPKQFFSLAFLFYCLFQLLQLRKNCQQILTDNQSQSIYYFWKLCYLNYTQWFNQHLAQSYHLDNTLSNNQCNRKGHSEQQPNYCQTNSFKFDCYSFLKNNFCSNYFRNQPVMSSIDQICIQKILQFLTNLVNKIHFLLLWLFYSDGCRKFDRIRIQTCHILSMIKASNLYSFG